MTSDAPADVAQLRQDAIHVIKNWGTAEQLAAILNKVKDPRELDVPTSDKEYPDSLLEEAIHEGAIDCARALIASGADPMRAQRGGSFLPVHLLADSAGRMRDEVLLEFVELLAAAGGDFDAKDEKGWTPLHYAINAGGVRLVRILIQRGAYIDPKLLDDPQLQAKFIPVGQEGMRPLEIEALEVARRALRAAKMGQSVLSAMSDGGAPAAKPSRGMAL